MLKQTNPYRNLPVAAAMLRETVAAAQRPRPLPIDEALRRLEEAKASLADPDEEC